MNIKIRVCQIIGPAAAGSAGPVPIYGPGTQIRNYTPMSMKNVPSCCRPYFRQMLTDFKKSFTGALCGKCATQYFNPMTAKL